MNRYRSIVFLSLALVLGLACGLGGGAAGSSAGGSAGAKFPMPPSVKNLTTTSTGEVNFQTSMSLKDTIAFYREAFAKAGLKERTMNTSITDTTFSMVFDGDPSGKAVVIQGVDLGNGTTNVNIRYESV